MTVTCAWCLTVLVAGRGPVSHGICSVCAGEFEEAFESEARTLSERDQGGLETESGKGGTPESYLRPAVYVNVPNGTGDNARPRSESVLKFGGPDPVADATHSVSVSTAGLTAEPSSGPPTIFPGRRGAVARPGHSPVGSPVTGSARRVVV